MPITPTSPRVLLTAAAETGSSVSVVAGTYNWYVQGTWDGATAQLQFSRDGGSTWMDVDGISATTDWGWTGLQMAVGHVRVEISNAGTTSLSSDLRGVA